MTGDAKDLRRARIMVVDDDALFVELLQAVLTFEGYEVFGAHNGVDALEKAKSESPDLILLDIMMPYINGWEVCTRLKENWRTRDIPIMMISGLGTLEDIVRALRLGASDYLVKPFSFNELLARVNSLIWADLSRRQEVKEQLTELLFDENWVVLLVYVRDWECIGQIADLLHQVEARFMGRWDETEFVLILGPEQAKHEYARLEATDLPLSLGMVSGGRIGGFVDAEDIIAAAFQSLVHID